MTCKDCKKVKYCLECDRQYVCTSFVMKEEVKASWKKAEKAQSKEKSTYDCTYETLNNAKRHEVEVEERVKHGLEITERGEIYAKHGMERGKNR